jgi:hypothetical protein
VPGHCHTDPKSPVDKCSTPRNYNPCTITTINERRSSERKSSPHNVNGKNAALMTRPPPLKLRRGNGLKRSNGQSPSHNVNRQNPALMTRQQIIDKVTDDRVGFVAELCYDTAYQGSAARMPFQINRSMNIPGAMYFRPAMRTPGLFGPDFQEAEFLLQLRVAHDFVSQRSAPCRDYLDNGCHRFRPYPIEPNERKSKTRRLGGCASQSEAATAAAGTSRERQRILFLDGETRPAECRRF